MVKFIATKTEFDALLKDNSRVMIDFTASWCGPCKRIAPEYETLADDNKNIAFVKIDVDVEAMAEVLKTYEISAMPTFVAIKDSEKVGIMKGASLSGLQALVKDLNA